MTLKSARKEKLCTIYTSLRVHGKLHIQFLFCRRFFKRYLTFWHLYNMVADCFFLIGLLMKLLEHFLVVKDTEETLAMIDMNGLAASGRILWGAAFCLAILKTIKA